DDVDPAGDLGQRPVALGAVDRLGPGVDRHDLHAELLDVGGDVVGRAGPVVRQPDDGPAAGGGQEALDDGDVVVVAHAGATPLLAGTFRRRPRSTARRIRGPTCFSTPWYSAHAAASAAPQVMRRVGHRPRCG